MEEYDKKNNRGRIGRTIAIVAVVTVFVVLIFASLTSKPYYGDQVWYETTTVGDLDAKNYYIMYTDIMCPYCDVFSREIQNHWDEFENYIADNNILFEVRLTDYLYEGNGTQASRDSAEGAYCAARENRFWDYYHASLQNLWNDYHSKGIGVSKTAPHIENMPDDYWKRIGHEINLSDEFDKCLDNHETVDLIVSNTAKALQVTNGMPSFKFNRFTTAGFDNNWGWDYVLQYLDAGLGKRNKSSE